MSTEAHADVCEAYRPFVYGGRLNYDTVVAPGAWRGTEWPCKGRTEATGPDGAPLGITIVCSCPCHTGALEHELPPHARRTAVHPTEVIGGR